MKANHNALVYGNEKTLVGLNISNSKNESKSQHLRWLVSQVCSWVKYQ
ncbi:hypothetical protein GO621_09425 [Mucilaginibacter sp. HMF7410]|uniref:Uncharacterized protein n=1 Tax=Mucilaginibacter arboris TaxID=2682090 RepID=A0A7K1SWQ7_9SPHI|nr:hypothetical protein [Mucilaginibacter arboris]MVN21756.1 hypothetical protein [Mucilaginibacter arboris]